MLRDQFQNIVPDLNLEGVRFKSVTTNHLGRALKAKRREMGRQSIREAHQDKVDQAQPTPTTQTPALDMRHDLGKKEAWSN